MTQTEHYMNSAYRRKHFAKPKDTRVRRLIRDAVHNRDDGICQLCGRPVDYDANPNHRLAPSLDHIVPFADGGEFTVENLRLAHAFCNWQRHHADQAASRDSQAPKETT